MCDIQRQNVKFKEAASYCKVRILTRNIGTSILIQKKYVNKNEGITDCEN